MAPNKRVVGGDFNASGETDSRFDFMKPVWDLQDGGYGGAYGAGRTALIAQVFDSGDNRYEFTGNQNVDAVLIGSKWTQNNLTFSFPTSGAFYANEGYDPGTEPDTHVVFNNAQKTALRYAFDLLEQYTLLNVNEVTETATTHANFRFSQTDNDSLVPSAYANFPSSSLQAGDSWFGMTGQPFYTTPAPGNWGQATMMHELGHALGLKHGHQDYTSVNLSGEGYLDPPPGGGGRFGSAALPSDHDGQAWSLMTYRSNPSAGVTFQGDGFNQPQTYMQNDIAALQHLYGADFTTNAGATTYRWNPTTGEMSINGVAQGAPSGNKILSTLWDGNGVDTYHLANYSGGVKVDLNPGAFSTFSTAQLVNHQPLSGNPSSAIAPGNVANALLFNNDARSLIENVVGGAGADFVLGNAANNVLSGNNQIDTLIGDVGNDRLLGGNGADKLYGDALPGQPAGVGLGTGLVVKPSGAGNNTLDKAIDVTKNFSLANDTDIITPTTVRHVTVQGTGDGNKDYYKVTVNAGSTLTFDIDHTNTFDSFLILYDSKGTQLFLDDDSLTTDGAGGSTTGTDSFLRYKVAAAGTYIIEVGDYLTSTTDEPIAAGNTYELQISAEGVPAQGKGNGNDVLDGGASADQMYGGLGNDTYFVENANDLVFESSTQGTNDRIAASVDYTLKAGVYVEQLLTSNVTGGAAIDLKGNAFVQKITGNNGLNRLDDGGGAGKDTLTGLGGNDTYVIGNAGTVIVEAAGGGNDTALIGLSYVLKAGADVQFLTAIDGTKAIDLTGNQIRQIVTGNNGSNRIDGMGGNDTLVSKGGQDTFVFSTKLGATNVDHIKDFSGPNDQIELSDAIFTVLAPGVLANNAFKSLDLGAKDANDRIIYDRDTGDLFYDRDGTGTVYGEVRFAVIDTKVALTAADFNIV